MTQGTLELCHKYDLLLTNLVLLMKKNSQK